MHWGYAVSKSTQPLPHRGSPSIQMVSETSSGMARYQKTNLHILSDEITAHFSIGLNGDIIEMLPIVEMGPQT